MPSGRPLPPPLDLIAERTRTLMRELGSEHLGRPLQDLGWRLEFDGARRRLGICKWKKGARNLKVISLSGPIAAREGWTLMEDVARHEIAHALDYETRGRSGHDEVWKAWARRCGADPSRAYEGELLDDPTSPYVGRCTTPGCDYARPFYRAVTSAYRCGRCNDEGRVSPLRIEDRATGRPLVDLEEGILPRRRPPKYLARCPSCGGTQPFGRRPSRRYACVKCCEEHAGGKFDGRFEMELFRIR